MKSKMRAHRHALPAFEHPSELPPPSARAHDDRDHPAATVAMADPPLRAPLDRDRVSQNVDGCSLSQGCHDWRRYYSPCRMAGDVSVAAMASAFSLISCVAARAIRANLRRPTLVRSMPRRAGPMSTLLSSPASWWLGLTLARDSAGSRRRYPGACGARTAWR
jgi:hypothetical protein